MSLQNKTILIVEDNIVNRVTYQMALVHSGANVVFDRWGTNALTSLKHQRNVDLIILDLMLMRGENGYNLFQEIRQHPEYVHIPIIAISAVDPYEAIARCQELGFDSYIAKPINELEFPEQLTRILNGEAIWSM